MCAGTTVTASDYAAWDMILADFDVTDEPLVVLNQTIGTYVYTPIYMHKYVYVDRDLHIYAGRT